MQQQTDIQLLSKVQKTLTQNPNASQRELASSTNLSLGMTNALLKRFSDKGWLYMKKISTRNIQYVLTPSGINELVHRSSRYFKRTTKLMKEYKDIIYDVINTSNCEKAIMVGSTDLEFLFDFACMSINIPLLKTDFLPATLENDALVIFCDEEAFQNATKTNIDKNNIICITRFLQNKTIEQEELSWQIS